MFEFGFWLDSRDDDSAKWQTEGDLEALGIFRKLSNHVRCLEVSPLLETCSTGFRSLDGFRLRVLGIFLEMIVR